MKKNAQSILFLISISAIVYLPHIGNLTYYKDEWYFIYDAYVGGAGVFRNMFQIDRPARGIFFEIIYFLFKYNPLPYHLGGLFWRILSAVGAYLIFQNLWGQKGKVSFYAALLFSVYPGYVWWISALEYQPHIASLAFQTLSIAFTLYSIKALSRIEKTGYLVAAILTGWIYLSLVEYAIGMEIFRLLCVYILAQQNKNQDFQQKIISTIQSFGWNVVISIGFILWRVFVFQNERKATDIGGQLNVLFDAPIHTLADWVLKIYTSLLNISVLAWLNQFPAFMQTLRVRDLMVAIFMTGFALFLLFLSDQYLQREERRGRQQTLKEIFLLGGVGMLFGIVPIVMANRYIDIGGFSYYSLPASLAVAIFIVGIAEIISIQRVRTVMLYVLLAFASLSHFGIATHAITEEKAIQEFWRQVSWRVPALRPGTTLVIHYPLPGMGDGGFALMEAANVIYFPEPTNEVPVHYPVSGLTLNSENLPGILDGTQVNESGYRSHTYTIDYTNILVLSQPTLNSCVHVIYSASPLISEYDPLNVALVAGRSNIDNVIADAEPMTPPVYIFGEETERGWCHYFQAADLAAQLGDWERVAALGDEAIALSFAPEDRVEWLPFLKGYAIRGDADTLKQLSRRVIGVRSIRLQACELLSNIEQPFAEDVKQVVDKDYCKNSE